MVNWKEYGRPILRNLHNTVTGRLNLRGCCYQTAIGGQDKCNE
jgi:hypothetical protein